MAANRLIVYADTLVGDLSDEPLTCRDIMSALDRHGGQKAPAPAPPAPPAQPAPDALGAGRPAARRNNADDPDDSDDSDGSDAPDTAGKDSPDLSDSEASDGSDDADDVMDMDVAADCLQCDDLWQAVIELKMLDTDPVHTHNTFQRTCNHIAETTGMSYVANALQTLCRAARAIFPESRRIDKETLLHCIARGRRVALDVLQNDAALRSARKRHRADLARVVLNA